MAGLRPSALLRQALFRPAIVTEHADNTLSREGVRWRLFRVASWVITGAAGLTMAFVETYPGKTRDGEHCFSGLQWEARRLKDYLLAGEWGPPAPQKPVATQAVFYPVGHPLRSKSLTTASASTSSSAPITSAAAKSAAGNSKALAGV